MKQKDKMQEFKFNFNFREILQEKNIQLFFEDVQNELVFDSLDFVIIDTNVEDGMKRAELVTQYIAKYSVFIHKLETAEEYDKCKEIIQMFKLSLCEIFGYDPLVIQTLLKQNLNLLDDSKDKK